MRLALLCVAAVAAGTAQAPRFRADADLVRIDVLVVRDGRPVTGLTAADFIVEDTGVRQRAVVLPSAESLSVSTVLDMSGSISPSQLANAASAVDAVRARLQPSDRHQVYGFAAEPRIITAPPGGASPLDSIASALRATGGSHTALFDALHAAIVRGADAAGPSLVVAVTDGHDNVSWLDAQAVVDAALRHDTVIYPVAMPAPANHPAEVPAAAADAGLRLLDSLADRTGGRVVHTDWSKDLGPVLQSILAEHRQRYILGFAPTGVARGDGWHRLTIRLRGRTGTVRARGGYWSR
jgi:VWFA-related protein